MSSASTLSTRSPHPIRSSHEGMRLFYVGAAVVMLLAVVIGFRHFFFYGTAHPGRELTPSIRTLIIVHGISMTAWLLVFLVQSLLIATRRRRLHTRLGPLAVVLAVSLFVSGFWFVLASFRLAPPQVVIWTLTMKQFMLLGFYTLFMFATFVSVGIWHRRNPVIHRPMMLLATLSIMVPAIARIDAISVLYQGTPLEPVFGPSLGMLVLGATFLLIKTLITKSVDTWYVSGYGVLAVTHVLVMQLARTNAWDNVATHLLR